MSDEIVTDFLVESRENLDQLDRDLISLEKEPTSQATLASVFRTIHTIKGTCGFLGFQKLQSVAHVGENLLSRLRDGQLLFDASIANALLAMVDAVRQMLAQIESAGHEGDGDYSGLIQELSCLQEDSPPTPAEVDRPAATTTAPARSSDVQAELADTKATAERGETATRRLGDMLVETGVVKREDLERALGLQAGGDQRYIGEILIEQGAAEATQVFQTLVTQQESRAVWASEGTIRVDVGLLDKLMNLVGELVLARNQILQFTATQEDTAFIRTSQRLNLITTELQEGVMKTRMQPIGNVWNRFPRVVRDLAQACSKQVRVEMEGKETELDKTIIEAIKDPLTHLVRNSVDHGIEKPEVRQAQGKPAEGRFFLRAFHEGGQVNIEISDDGGGINGERVKQKAVQRGLISREQASRLSEREMLNLIFLPGLSTAEAITNVSGRGVGMDVVKTNIEKIGGTVDVQSILGQGTTLKIKIPLTLAIIPALIVTSGNDRYAIPQVSLLELVRLEAEQARKGIEMIHDAPVYRLRGNLLPLVYLNRELQVESEAAPDDAVNIVVLEADGRQFGLVVDHINDTEEIVVKPLSKQLKGISVFAGATIMGDGRVALILDVLGMAQRAKVVTEVRERNMANHRDASREQRAAVQTFLLCELGVERRVAIPLSLVARLEEVPRDTLETADDREVVQYRGQILPLLRLSELLGCSGPDETCDPLPIVVHSDGGLSVGLVVGRIIDIVETAVQIQRQGRRDGLLGSAVIQGRVTDLVDLPGVIRLADECLSAVESSFLTVEDRIVAHTRQFSTFYLDRLFFGVEVEQVQEVIRYQEITRVPLAPRTVQGLINLRGQIVTAIDLRRRLGLADRPAEKLPMNVVVRTDEGPVSLLVDEIGDVQEVQEDSFESPPETLAGVARELIGGAYKLDGRLLLVLNTGRTVNLTDKQELPSGVRAADVA